jgi:hypothetical protein
MLKFGNLGISNGIPWGLVPYTGTPEEQRVGVLRVGNPGGAREDRLLGAIEVPCDGFIDGECSRRS